MEQKKPTRNRSRDPIKESRWRFRGMTVRDWLELLIVPLALAAIGLWFTAEQNVRQQALENQRPRAERELEEQRTQDAVLQAYLDQMTNLLREKNLRESAEESEVRMLAQARTLAVLGGLDASRKTEVVRFLAGAALVQTEDGRDPVIALDGADLNGVAFGDPKLQTVDLSGAHLKRADLRGAYLFSIHLADADLRGAILANADLRAVILSDADLRAVILSDADLRAVILSDADLREVNLNGTNLADADLIRANLGPPGVNAKLIGANLTGADLRDADLRYSDLSDASVKQADLSGADLSWANRSGANLEGANLNGADLSNVRGITKEQLEQQARSLEGTIIPDGQKKPLKP